jgi:antitoxin MazE
VSLAYAAERSACGDTRARLEPPPPVQRGRLDIHCISAPSESKISQERVMKAKIAKWGNSLGLRLPNAAVKATGLRPGDEVDVAVDRNELRIKPIRSTPFYRLEDLLAEIDRRGPGNQPESIDWGPDVGAEIIDDAYSRGEITLDDILSGRLKGKNAS